MSKFVCTKCNTYNEEIYLIIYCLDCIRCMQDLPYEAGPSTLEILDN